MPRRPGVHLDGVPLHIVQRGHNRAPCFFGEEDYLGYRYWLGEALKESRCALGPSGTPTFILPGPICCGSISP